MTDENFIDELARQKVPCIGCGLQPAGKFYRDRQPYLYGLLADGDITNENIADYIASKLGRSSKATFAGLGVQGQERKYGIFFPSTLYGANAKDLEQRLASKGIKVTRSVGYSSDINTAQQQATNAIQQMSQAGVTTLMCVCDPVAPVFLTSAATQQQYNPEWLQTAYYGQDLDLVARFYDQTQWAHSFGPGQIPPGGPPEEGAPWKAYRKESGDKTGKVPNTVGYIWSPVSLAFAAIENNGANLNPFTMQDTIFNVIKIKNINKFAPEFGYGPMDLGGIDDAQEIWWDANGMGPDGVKGTYRGVNDYRRFVRGTWPATPTQAFKPECTGRGTCGAAPGPNQP